MTHPTVDQLQVLIAVADAGGFSAAARRLNRAQSVVSYTIANLEAQVGLALFDRRGTRAPTLTDAGHAVLADARRVVSAVDGLKARAKGMRDGLEAQVTLAVDVMFPSQVLAGTLHAFQKEFPTVSLRLHVETLGGVAQLVLAEAADVGISGPVSRYEGVIQQRLGDMDLVPVVAPSHPLASLQEAITEAVLQDHTQLVLTDRSAITQGRDFNVLSAKTWRIGDLGAKHTLLLAGLGWGTMPEPIVHDDLAAGRLVSLEIPALQSSTYWFVALHRSQRPPGPAGAWLLDRFVDPPT